MKRALLIIVALCLTVGCLSGCADRTAQSVSIIFATDTHYLSPELTDGGALFKEAVALGDGKLIEYSEEINEAFFAEVIEKQPDLLVLGGDLTLNGAVQSHRDFVKKLERVQEAGIQVLVIPGNHDAGREFAIKYMGKDYELVDALTSQQFFEYYSPFGREQAESRDESSFSYIYRASDELKILMLDANCGGSGFLKDGTLDWIKAELKLAKRQGTDVIAVCHQNLFAHNPLLSFGYQLLNADKLQALMEKYKVRLIFSGHIHIQSAKAENSITEIVTSSLEMAPIQYGTLTYDGKGVDYAVQRVDVSKWLRSHGQAAPELEDFAAFATEYFEYTSRLKVEKQLADSPLSADEKALIADAFARANTLYFAGERFDPSQFDEAMELIESSGTAFFGSYLNSMFESAAVEKRNLRVLL